MKEGMDDKTWRQSEKKGEGTTDGGKEINKDGKGNRMKEGKGGRRAWRWW